MNICDNGFGSTKVGLLYEMITQSSIQGFSLNNNMAENLGLEGNENSSFDENVRPIKNLTNIVSYLRWPKARGC